MCFGNAVRFAVFFWCVGLILAPAVWAGPTVTMEQDPAQGDPASAYPVSFLATFSEPVTGFDADDSDDVDVVFTGDVRVESYTVTSISADNSVYAVDVTAGHKFGSLTASVPAGVCVNAAEVANDASTSTDNEVDFAARRILIMGDSWSYFPWQQRSLRMALKRAGMGQFCEEGANTAVALNSTAAEWAANYQPNPSTPGRLDAITAQLAKYPTIDIVHVSIGGNDFLKEWDPDWTLGQETAFFQEVVSNTSFVIDHILAQRPDIRVAYSGYDYMREPIEYATPQEVNEAGIRFTQMAMAMVQTKGPRVVYLHNYGICQYEFGEDYQPVGIWPNDPYLIPPDYTQYAEPYPAHSVPRPEGPYWDPPYANFPGGDRSLLSPVVAMLRPPLSGDIHLSLAGYLAFADNCVRQVYQYWLAWPRVYSMDSVPSEKEGEADFVVVFSEPVFGVDASDFVVHTSLGKELTTAYISSVEGVGTDEIRITVKPGDYQGPVTIELVDDDSIYDLDDNPLGGPGEGNGGFAICGQVSVKKVPVVAWPIALFLMAGGVTVLRRRPSRSRR